jgi:hypothetical protein
MEKFRGKIQIGEVVEGEFEPGATLIPSAEFDKRYAGATDAEKAAIMEEVEYPPDPRLIPGVETDIVKRH